MFCFFTSHHKAQKNCLAFAYSIDFLLPIVHFVIVLELSRHRIQTSEWVQYNIPGFIFLFEWRCIYLLIRFHSLETRFACPIPDAISVLLSTLLNIKVPKLILLLEYISFHKDVDLWTFIILRNDHYFCLFTV